MYVLESLSKRVIEHSIALHLFLDVGNFLRQITVTTMRCDQTSKYFWLLVQKLWESACTHAPFRETMEKDYHVIWVLLHV